MTACHSCLDKAERAIPARIQAPPNICVALQPNFFINTEAMGPVQIKKEKGFSKLWQFPSFFQKIINNLYLI